MDGQCVNPDHYRLACPEWGSGDICSIGSMNVGASAEIYVTSDGRGSGPDWDYDPEKAERDHSCCYVYPDYEHSSCHCNKCGKDFSEPDIIAVGDAEIRRLEHEQLEREGQQNFFVNRNDFWLDGQPCNHAGCLSHISHACEGCGRIRGKGKVPKIKIELIEGAGDDRSKCKG